MRWLHVCVCVCVCVCGECPAGWWGSVGQHQCYTASWDDINAIDGNTTSSAAWIVVSVTVIYGQCYCPLWSVLLSTCWRAKILHFSFPKISIDPFVPLYLSYTKLLYRLHMVGFNLEPVQKTVRVKQNVRSVTECRAGVWEACACDVRSVTECRAGVWEACACDCEVCHWV